MNNTLFIDKRNHIATNNKYQIAKDPFGKRLAQFPINTLQVVISRYFTDVDGQIVDKLTVPANLQTKYPFYMLGGFDLFGGYKSGSLVCPSLNGIDYLTTFVNGYNFTSENITGFTGLNDIQTRLQLGDIVHVFTDNRNTPNYYIWVVLSSNGFAGLSSMVTNLMTAQNDNRFGRLFIDSINLVTPSYNQWKQDLFFVVFDNVGNYSSNPITPLQSRTPLTETENLIRLPIEFQADQMIGVYSYIVFDVDNLSFDFQIKKVTYE